jgi:predicted glycoside hydrolase/deacetylase ChbG (UPF0249 family)
LKILIPNADDFGFTPSVNEGIVHAHRHGILTAATLMANGEAFEDAVRLARETPSLDVGCHLVLVGGRPLATPYERLPRTAAELVAAVVRRRIEPYRELRLQIERILAAGVEPTHLDTHKHTHLLPPVLEAVARLSQEFGIAWVRRPFDFPLTAVGVPWGTRAANRGLGLLRPRFHRVLEKYGCRTADHFAGFQITGRFRMAELVKLIHSLPEGVTEFMCHPGWCREDLRKASTRLKESREEELRALTAPEVRTALAAAGVRLMNFREIPAR